MKHLQVLFMQSCTCALLAACATSAELPVKSLESQKLLGKDQLAGQLIGKIVPGSKFSALQIGMTRQEVEVLTGRPTEVGAQATGSAWLPYYFGSDTWRTESYYKGEGRLVFNADSRLVLIDVSENARK